MTDCTIGIDLGSTSIKGVLYSPVCDEVLHIESRQIFPRVATVPTQYEEDPIVIRDAAFDVVHALAQQAKEIGVRIVRIAVTGQMHGGLLVDAGLKPVTNFITWQDKRGDEKEEGKASLVQNLVSVVPFDLMEETGGYLFTGYLGVTIASLLKQDALLAHAHSMLGIYDWLACMLAGAKPTTDITSASAWGMYSITRKCWIPEILQAAGIEERLLPIVLEPGAVLGTISPQYAQVLELPPDLEIVIGLGDTQASYLGCGGAPDKIVLNFGTGSQCLWETEKTFPTPGTDTRYLGDGRHLATVPTLAGGLAYQLLEEFFEEVVREFSGTEVSKESAYSAMERLGRQVGDVKGLSFTPLFNGSRFLASDERAAITGLSRQNFHPGNMISALLHGMIEEVAAPFFARQAGASDFDGLIGSGNGMRRNKLLQEIASKRFGLPLSIPKHPEEAAVGAALVASWRGTLSP